MWPVGEVSKGIHARTVEASNLPIFLYRFLNGLLIFQFKRFFTVGRLSIEDYARLGTSLVAQWLRICLPMQGTQVRALVREDPTCRRATKPTSHNYWACTLEPVSHNY